MKTQELYINGNYINIKDTEIVLDYNVKTIHEPIDNPGKYTSDSTGTYSLDFDIVGSKDVNILFENIFEINGQVTYYPNKRNTAELRVGSQSILNGSIQLNYVTKRKIGDNEENVYNVTLYGYSKSLFVDLKDKNMIELDFSQFDHLPTHLNMVQSWNNLKGYVYGLVDYGMDFNYSTSYLISTTHGNIGLNNMYDSVGNLLSPMSFPWTYLRHADLKPAVKVKTVLDAISNQFGYTFDGNFIKSTGFTNLVTPYSNVNQLPVTTQVSATTTSNYPILYQPNVPWSFMTFDTTYTDSYTQWMDSTDSSGFYTFKTFVSQISQHLYFRYEIYYSNTSNIPFYIVKDTLSGFGGSGPYPKTNFPNTGTYETILSTTLTPGYNLIEFEVDVKRDDMIFGYYGQNLDTPIQLTGTRVHITQDSGYTYDPFVHLGKCFPDDLKVTDYLNGLNKEFNLYWEIDKDDDTKILIQPYEEYYSSGITIHDWSDLIDRKSIEVDFSNDLQTSKAEFKYDKAEDYFNTRAIDLFNHEYGSYLEFFSGNSFIEDKTLEVDATPFLPSVIVSITNWPNGPTNFYLPKYLNSDLNYEVSTDIGLRILYYNGLKTQNWYWDDTSFLTYPQFSTFSDHNNLTGCTDLNYKTTQTFFPADGGWTNLNLYELYWKNYLFNLNDSNMKIVKGNVYLNEVDIYNLRLKDTIYWNEAFWRIQSLKYNVGKKLHEVELLKVLDELDLDAKPSYIHKPFVISNTNFIPKSKGSTILSTDYNLMNASNTLVVGGINSVVSIQSGISNVIINGNGNQINDGSRLVNIEGDNNLVTSGASNIFIFGSGITTSTSDSFIVNSANIIMNGYNISNLSADTVWERGIGSYSVQTIGTGCVASGNTSVAEGNNSLASGLTSHAEGDSTWAQAAYSHAEGISTEAKGAASHAEGNSTRTVGDASHAEGDSTVSEGYGSHAEGGNTTTSKGNYSHSEGSSTSSWGIASHSEGNGTLALGHASHAEGFFTSAITNYSHVEGQTSKASGLVSHAEGLDTLAFGDYSHSEGYLSASMGNQSHCEGYQSTASGLTSHAEGFQTFAQGNYSHSEGHLTRAYAEHSHAEGAQTYASATYAHAQGYLTVSSGISSHAEGYQSQAVGVASHAEGYQSQTNNNYTHAEGYQSQANGIASHCEGFQSIADAHYSHAGGLQNWLQSTASGSTMTACSGLTGVQPWTLYTNNININGNQIVKTRLVTTGYTLTEHDFIVAVSASTSQNLILPLASTCIGRMYNIKSVGANHNLIPSGSDKIDYSSSWIIPSLSNLTAVAIDSSNWYII